MKKNFRSEFIDKANSVYDSKFNYSLVRYNGATKKVLIICPRHGVFEQSPSTHLRGSDCPYCKKDIPTRTEFIKQMNKLYLNGHDYAKCEYHLDFRSSDYLSVTCKKHGDFYVRVVDYMKGKGCPACNQSVKKEDKYILSLVYKTSDKQVFLGGDQFNTKSAAKRHLNDLKDALELTGATIQSAEITKKETNQYSKSRIGNPLTLAKRLASAVSIIVSFLKL